MNLILRILAAIHIGKDEYPPMPKIIDGLLNSKNISDLIIEKIMVKIEINNLKKFVFTNNLLKTAVALPISLKISHTKYIKLAKKLNKIWEI